MRGGDEPVGGLGEGEPVGQGGEGEEVRLAGGPLLVFTAAELSVIEQAHLDSLADAGSREQGDPGGRQDGAGTRSGATEVLTGPGESVLREARLSLVSRGLVGRDGRIFSGSAPADLAALLLDIRLGATALIVIERRIAGREHRPDLRIVHLIPEGGVIEDIHPDGLIGFDLDISPAELVRAALAPVLPSDARPGAGPTRQVDPQHPEQFAHALDEPGVLAELTLAAGDGERLEAYLLAVGRSGCFLSRRPAGTGPTGASRVTADPHPSGESDDPCPSGESDCPADARPSSEPLMFVPAAPQDVEDLITRWVCDVVDALE